MNAVDPLKGVPLRRRAPGFRFPITDAAVIVSCAAATWLLWDAIGGLVLLFPIVLAHFFLSATCSACAGSWS